ncbi:hypothetical protein CRENPOLYSF2_3620005 [Crenothrix polyspora]|uniref:Uncharacterized protein n=1 Tax=Crenothrix polyspora TaxID=360316 RepID=A0A1R4HC19_9GAMM|nr:hypothetical protein CRENPOLYSF2_3620005 [Crenothrix polyspora]
MLQGKQGSSAITGAYFVTSNTSDYGKVNAPLIYDELNGINATLIDNLPWALAIVEGRA